jgi:hypothetical protein
MANTGDAGGKSAIIARGGVATWKDRVVHRHPEPHWELSIGPDTVRLFILKARALGAALDDGHADGSEHEVEFDGDGHDNHHHDGLAEEETEDLTAEELRELIEDLNVDETAELIALVWIGRGDYSVPEWNEALAAARERVNRRSTGYLLGMPHLAEWLEEGLDAIGA